MRYVKIYMRKKDHDIVLTFEQAEKLFDSPQQLVKLSDKEGKWTGVVINKAEIITSNRDYEKEKQERYNPSQLPEPKLTPDQQREIDIKKAEIAKKLKFRKYEYRD